MIAVQNLVELLDCLKFIRVVLKLQTMIENCQIITVSLLGFFCSCFIRAWLASHHLAPPTVLTAPLASTVLWFLPANTPCTDVNLGLGCCPLDYWEVTSSEADVEPLFTSSGASPSFRDNLDIHLACPFSGNG
jgi:hypothetical protein